MTAQPRTEPSLRTSEAGFSILEVLIASALFFVISISIAGLFIRSTSNNYRGADSTRLANLSKTAMEERLFAPFDSTALTVPAGATQASVTEYWNDTLHGFTTTAPAPGSHVDFVRTLTVRYCGMSDLDDNGQCDEPLQGDSDPGLVHLKEIRVDLRSRPGGLLGGQSMQLVTYKPF